MLLFQKTTQALASAISVNAAAIDIRSTRERRATQSCHVKDNGLWFSFGVWDGIPYYS